MVVYMIMADVERYGEFVVPLKSKTFIVTWEGSSLFIAPTGLSSQTLDLLLFILAFAGDYHLGLAWLIFLARIRCMTGIQTYMATARSCLLLATRVRARRPSVFTLSMSVA